MSAWRLALLPALAAAVTIAAGIAVTGTATAEEPHLSVRTTQVLLPIISIEALDAGDIESDPARGRYAIEVDVDAEDSQGWVLYLRAEQATFMPEGGGKPCTDALWKFDEENRDHYRRLDSYDMVVLDNPAGGDARITLDLSVELGWQTDPGTYGLGLVFRIAGY